MEALGLERRLGLVVLWVPLQVGWDAPVRWSGVIYLGLYETSKHYLVNIYLKKLLFLCCYAAPYSLFCHYRKCI